VTVAPGYEETMKQWVLTRCADAVALKVQSGYNPYRHQN